MIEFQSVTKEFQNVVAVKDLSLKVEKGSLFGFLGPNGAGKTTTIKMIVGIMRPTRGKIKILGMDTQEQPEEIKKYIGYIPDRPYLYEKLTANEFLYFVSRLYNTQNDTKVRERKDFYLELFSLTEWKDELIENFSHGMKQRLIITSVLMRDPEIIVVDEPMVGLDPIAVRLVKDIFKKMASDGKTIFMSTHSIYIAQEICSEIGVINKGSLIIKDTTSNIMKSFYTLKSLEDIFLKLTLETQAQ